MSRTHPPCRYISEILLVTNPFKRIQGLYDDDVKNKYKGCNWHRAVSCVQPLRKYPLLPATEAIPVLRHSEMPPLRTRGAAGQPLDPPSIF